MESWAVYSTVVSTCDLGGVFGGVAFSFWGPVFCARLTETMDNSNNTPTNELVGKLKEAIMVEGFRTVAFFVSEFYLTDS